MAQDASPGYLLYGPGTPAPLGENVAVFKAMIDSLSGGNSDVMRVEVYNTTTSTVVASRTVTRSDFQSSGNWEFFSVPFVNRSATANYEYRVYWPRNAFINVDRVLLNRGGFTLGFRASTLTGATGTFQANGFWDDSRHAQEGTDAAGYLSNGPGESNIPAGSLVGEWMLKLDDVTSADTNIARLEVYDVTSGTVLAQRTVKRSEFTTANRWQGFTVPFTRTGTSSLVLRTYWFGHSRADLRGVIFR